MNELARIAGPRYMYAELADMVAFTLKMFETCGVNEFLALNGGWVSRS